MFGWINSLAVSRVERTSIPASNACCSLLTASIFASTSVEEADQHDGSSHLEYLLSLTEYCLPFDLHLVISSEMSVSMEAQVKKRGRKYHHELALLNLQLNVAVCLCLLTPSSRVPTTNLLVTCNTVNSEEQARSSLRPCKGGIICPGQRYFSTSEKFAVYLIVRFSYNISIHSATSN